MTRRFEGRVALITGAGSVGSGVGNGKAVAMLLARQGAAVFACDNREDALDETIRLVREEGGNIDGIAADVTHSASVRTLVDACVDAHGRIDVLYNNVGGSAPGGPAEMDEEMWHAQVYHNLHHVYYMCHRVLPIMEAQGTGTVVNVASVAAYRHFGHSHVAYAATKAAVIQFTRHMAVQYAPKGVRCNTVVPGLMHTPLVEARLIKQRGAASAEDIIAERNAKVPMGHMGDAWDVAHAVAFLASDEARYITGTEIVVDGGLIAKG